MSVSGAPIIGAYARARGHETTRDKEPTMKMDAGEKELLGQQPSTMTAPGTHV
jgi:hypothetical protein